MKYRYLTALFIFLLTSVLAIQARNPVAKLTEAWTKSNSRSNYERNYESLKKVWKTDGTSLSIKGVVDEGLEIEFKSRDKHWTALCFVEREEFDCSGLSRSGRDTGIKARLYALSSTSIKLNYRTIKNGQFGKTYRVTFKDAKQPVKKQATPPFRGCPDGSELVPSQNLKFEKEVLKIVNKEREKRGLASLQWSDSLGYAARYHAGDMASENYFDHTSRDRRGSSLVNACGTFARIRAFHSGGAMAENIAAGSSTPAGVMRQWMNSPGHKRNILTARYRKLGVGLYYIKGSRYGYYWVQNFSD